MSSDVYSAPQSSLVESERGEPRLWNPNPAGLWSLLFTPVFGSVLIYKNWVEIGDKQEVNKAKAWIIISVVVAVISAITGLAGFVYLIIWYFASQKKQAKYVKETLEDDYQKKGWLQPILIAIGVYFVVFVIVVGALVLTGI